MNPADYRNRLKETVLLPEIQQSMDGVTHCNHFVRLVAGWFGYHAFDDPDYNNGQGMRAGEMFSYMNATPKEWEKLSGPLMYFKARDIAEYGGLVIAADRIPFWNDSKKWAASGHVCIIAPENMMVKSGKWRGVEVPLVANVGTKERTGYGMGLNYAFHDQPALFAFRLEPQFVRLPLSGDVVVAGASL